MGNILKGSQIMALILEENGYEQEYIFEKVGSTKKSRKSSKVRKEPETLSEVSEVVFEYGRLALRVFDPMASRKFGLDEKYVRYEFDGGTMFMYKNENEPCFWSFSCGRGSTTLVPDSVKVYRSAVKRAMRDAISSDSALASAVPREIAYYL